MERTLSAIINADISKLEAIQEASAKWIAKSINEERYFIDNTQEL